MIFKFTDYRRFLAETFKNRENQGRGQLAKWAKAIGVHSTLTSLILRDKRTLSSEQALLTAQYLKLTDAETDYLLLLVQYDRTSHHKLREFLKNKIKAIQTESKKLKNQYVHQRKLAAEEREVFYSSWHYSAIRIFTSLFSKGCTIEDIVSKFKLERPVIVKALQFLEETQLIKRQGDRYIIGPNTTYLEREHPMLKTHLSNWRQKALQQFMELTEDEMMFTTTLSISKEDFNQLRDYLTSFVKKVSDTIQKTNPEDVAALNIDFFWIK